MYAVDPCDFAVDGRWPRGLENGPVRLLRNGRQRRAVGLYFSVKSGRHLPFESRLELHDLWRAEVDTTVVRSAVQPFTLQLASGGEGWRYTPDRLDRLQDGSSRVVEVKDDGWSQDDPRLAVRLEHVAAELACQGVPLQVHTRSQIQVEPSFSAVAAVQRHRRTAVSVEEQVAVEHALSRGETTLIALQRRLGGGPRAFAALSALMVRRVISIELGGGLHDEALVRARS